MSVALIAVEGVLRKLMGGLPIPEGLRLYSSLASTGQIILMSREDRAPLTDWLELHGLVRHAFVHECPRDFTLANQANVLRREGYAIDLVVVPEPQEAQTLIAAGFNTVLFTHAAYSHPSWRPDTAKGVQLWSEITEQVAEAARMKATDERLRADG